MAKSKYQLMTKAEGGHWVFLPYKFAINSKKEIVDILERNFPWNGATKTKNIDKGNHLDVEVTWLNLFGETITKTFSYKWEKVVE